MHLQGSTLREEKMMNDLNRFGGSDRKINIYDIIAARLKNCASERSGKIRF
jgi:hypothetical protein